MHTMESEVSTTTTDEVSPVQNCTRNPWLEQECENTLRNAEIENTNQGVIELMYFAVDAIRNSYRNHTCKIRLTLQKFYEDQSKYDPTVTYEQCQEIWNNYNWNIANANIDQNTDQ
jgi:hypothetical protein